MLSFDSMAGTRYREWQQGDGNFLQVHKSKIAVFSISEMF